jgi:predicted dienelactone hydrolase
MAPRHTAGLRNIEVPDPEGGQPCAAVIVYPTTRPERTLHLGPYTLDAASDAPVAGGPFPLVVVSHGTGGSHLLYRGIAAHLARAGFVVLLLEHPRNNRNDNSLAHTDTILADRPRQVRHAIDRAYADSALAPHLAPDAVAVVGHSLGGYTALAVAGGRPMASERETPDGVAHPVPVTPDPRVRALVLLAPATPWFMAPGALADVRVPILMLSGERDEHAPAWHAELVRGGVPDVSRIEYHVVPNAGHYSFLAPFPEHMVSAAFAPSQDPPGFDRSRFHRELNLMVKHFLLRTFSTERA